MSKVKKIIWIPIAIVVILAAVIVTLSVIKVNPVLNTFGDFDRIEVLVSSEDNGSGEVTDNNGVNVTKQKLSSGLESSSFSIMQAVLEGKFSYDIRVAKDEDKEEKMVTASDIKSYGALEGEYILKLHYGEVRELKVGDITVKYDVVLIRINETRPGEIEEMECIPYLKDNVYNASIADEYDEEGNIGSMYYETNVFTVKMITSKLLMNISELMGNN